MRTDCNSVATNDLAEKYLLGELGAAEQEAYELHYFECERCLVELQQLQAIQAVLRESPLQVVAAPTAPRQARWRRQRSWVGAMALAASIAGVALLVVSEQREQVAATRAAPAGPRVTTSPVATPPQVARAALESSPVKPSAAAPRRGEVLARLARVDPPRYSFGILRGVTDEATQSFHEGMHSYSRGDYTAAIPVLRRAASADPTRADIAFFLAAAELTHSDYVRAKAGFERVIAFGDTPFIEEAQFYRAIACLGSGDVEAARGALAVVVATKGEFAGAARRLVAELEHLPPE